MRYHIIIFWGILTFFLGGCATTPTEPTPTERQQAAQESLQRLKNSQNRVRTALSQVIQIGMSEEEVVKLIGRPTENNITRTAEGKSEQWVYTGEQMLANQGSQAVNSYHYVLNYIKDFTFFLTLKMGS